MADDGGCAATGSGEGASVSDFLLYVTDCGSFWDLVYWENVTGVDVSYEKCYKNFDERYVVVGYLLNRNR